MKTLYKNALITNHPEPTCMITDNDRIAYIGPNPTTDVDTTIDLANRHILPGFIDGHMHLLLFGSSLSKIDLGPCTSLTDIRNTILTHARQNPHLPRLFCRGWMHSMTDGAALASMLDDLDPRPIFIDAKDLHSAWCNTPALAELGVLHPGSVPDPAGGEIHRDESGTATGLLSEAAAVNIVWPHVARVASVEEKKGFVRSAVAAYQGAGYTGINEMATDENLWEIVNLCHYESGSSSGSASGSGGGLGVRMAGYWIISPKESEEEELRQVDRAVELFKLSSGDGPRIVGIKVICDGVVDACTAALTEAYASTGANCAPLWSKARLAGVVRRADAAGLQCALHAIGDATVRMVLDVLEAEGTVGRRHRIEHLELTTAEDAARLGRLGVTASVQPVHADPAILRAWPKLLGRERCARAFAYREFVDNKAPLAIGTDSPTAPHWPFRNLYTATTRKSAREPELPDTVNRHFGLSLLEAVNAATAGSAYACFADGVVGRLDVGMKADFVVVDMLWDEERLLEARVCETYFDGVRVYTSI
ncbi:putative metal-dependent hydrolase [Aspergillus avenaceus]|uniref:Putative metal-dependent hydrolase n=1 Tax=Aspergillus avenaceus TaxID=36643 RepID=A0A5N6TPV6_ASPAV|nr:putative metal-dependent hydrolase [Aspergillus avenaceus]